MPVQSSPGFDPVNWLNDFGDYLYGYAMSRVYNSTLAEDLVQDCLLSAWKAKSEFKGKSSVKTWLTSILRRKIIDHYRSASRKKEVSWEDYPSPFESGDKEKGQWIESRMPQRWGDSPISRIESDEFSAILQKCLSDLPIKWRSAISLKIFEEMTTNELCKELDVTTSNLWVLIHRAKLRLRECLEINWFKDS